MKLLLPKIDKLALLGIKEGKWVLKNIDKASEVKIDLIFFFIPVKFNF